MLKSELDKIDKQLTISVCEVLSVEQRVIKDKLDEQYKIISKRNHGPNMLKRVNNP